MRAAIIRERCGHVEIVDVAVDKPKGNEVLIRNVACGVCHSDLHVADGSFPSAMPVILGHEAAGVVEAVGEDVRDLKVGDHVVTCVSAYCGNCEYCLTGRLALCLRKGLDRPRAAPPRLRLNGPEGDKVFQFGGLGGFAETMLISERSCVAIPRDIPFDRAGLLGCAVATGVGAVIHTAKINPGATVAVIGCGGVGLMAVNGASIAGASRIVAIDRVPEKLELAKTMGATDVILADETDLAKQVIELTKGGVDYSFEAIGLKTTTEQAFRMLRPGGTATVVGVARIGTTFEISAMDLLLERKLQGSYIGSNRFPLDVPQFVTWYKQGKLKLDELVAGHYPLDRVDEALEELHSGKSARSIITLSDA